MSESDRQNQRLPPRGDDPGDLPALDRGGLEGEPGGSLPGAPELLDDVRRGVHDERKLRTIRAIVNDSFAQTETQAPPQSEPMAKEPGRRAAAALKALRERSGLSVRELAELLGQPASTYASYELKYKKEHIPADMGARLKPILVGRGTPPITEADVMRLVTGDQGGVGFAPGSDVQPAPGVPVPQLRVAGPLSVPVRGVVNGGPGEFFDVNLSDAPLEYVELPASLAGVPAGDVFALYVAGESMWPVWAPNDTVYVTKRRPIVAGCYVVALVDRGPGEPPGGLLKQFVSRNDGTVTLRQHNPDSTMVVDRHRVREMWRALHWRELMG